MSDESKIYPKGSENFSQPGHESDGKVAIDKDDIPEQTKATLKKYLSKNTEGKNFYPISAKYMEDPRTRELTSLDEEIDINPNVSGQIAEIKSDSNEHQFIDVNSDTEEAKNLRTLSDSGKFIDLENPQSTLKDFFDKNKRGDGHNFLRSIKHSRVYESERATGVAPLTDPTGRDKSELYKVPNDAPEVQKRISAVLKSNRFSPSDESPYIRGNAYTNPSAAFGSVQPKLGAYTTNSPAGDLAIEDLRKVAASLMLKQTGHAMKDSDPFNEDQLTVIAGPDPLGFDPRVDLDQMLARNAHKGSARRGRPQVDLGLDDEPDDGFMGGKNPLDGDGEFISITDGKSFGAANSYLETFTGNPLAAVTFILQGLLTMMVTGFVIGVFLDLLAKNVNPERAEGQDPSSLPMGKHSDSAAASLAGIGVPFLTKPIIACIERGIAAFFRVSPPESGSESSTFIGIIAWFALEAVQFWKFIPKIRESQGYYVSLIRNVMRDNSSILDIDPVAITAQVAMGAVTGGLRGVLASLVGIFSGLSSFKFFMACAVVGEKSLMDEARDFSGLGMMIDQIEDSGSTRITKSRVNKTTNALVWRHRSAPSQMLLPSSLILAKENLNNNPEAMALAAARVGDAEGESFRRKIEFSSTGRLKSEDVRKFEDDLESEYMPFYFHDLRTNEIISFHAFVDSITDSFSVQYQDTPAYGRVDPVKIYNTTTRNINLSFTLVSTSPEDFDSMWFSINKLTQMLYPQWSEGRAMSDGTNKFVMPFSQIPTSSPMIRLRLGDFIRSNGSKFSLARLFGAGLGKEKFSYGSSSKDQAKAEADAKKIKEDFEATLKKSYDTKEEKSTLEGTEAILKRSSTHGYATYEDKGTGFLGGPKLPWQTWTRSDAVVTVVEAQDRPETLGKEWEGKLKDEDFLSKKPYQYKVKFKIKDDPANPNDPSKEGYMLVLATDLKPIQDKKTKAFDDSKTFDTAASEFFTSKNNSIISAYESTAGRGLAGFITSMNFDYSQSTYEVGSLTRRAPMWLKVTMGFAPIHDIPPGMDSTGGNRAPLYPVGSISSHMAGDELADVREFGVDNKKEGIKDKFIKEQTKISKRDK